MTVDNKIWGKLTSIKLYTIALHPQTYTTQLPTTMNVTKKEQGTKIAKPDQPKSTPITIMFAGEIFTKLSKEKRALGFKHEQDVIRLAVGLYFERKG